MAVLKNLQVGPHKDTEDGRDGWVGMTYLGDFAGGDLVIPALNCKLQHRPGDVVFFRSAVLEHWVSHFEGERFALVLFSKNDLLEERLE